MKKQIEDKIIDNFEFAINGFNFYKVRLAMMALGWTWLGESNSPTVSQMEDEVRYLFNGALEQIKNKQNYGFCGSGGFAVTIDDDGLVTIQFIVDESSSEGNNE